MCIRDRRRGAAAVDEFLEVLEERGASLVAIEAAEIQDEFLRNAEMAEHLARRMEVAFRLQAHANDARRPESASRTRRHERFFFRRQEQVTGGFGEELRQGREVDRWILFRRGQQDGAFGDGWQTEERGSVAERPEQHEVVVAAMHAEMLEEGRRVRTVRAKPFQLPLGGRSKVVEDFVAQIGNCLLYT